MTSTMSGDVEDDIYSLKIYNFTRLHGTHTGSDEENDEKPQPRSGHRIQCTDTCLYSVGGYRPSNDDKLFREVWRFDFITLKWRKLDSKKLPKELASCSTLLSGNVLFLSGGTGVPFGQRLNESLYFCNLPKPGTTTVRFKEIKPCPHARYGHSMALTGDCLYTVGGTTGSVYSMDVHMFNLRTSEWEKLYDCILNDDGPPARHRHEMICYKDRLYIFGGGTQTSTYNLETLPAFNLKTNRWETFDTIGDIEDVEKFPVQRMCHGCAQDPYLPSLVYINGGCKEAVSSGHNAYPKAFSDTWRIDLDTLKWKRIPSLSLPYGLYFHSVSTTPDGRMCVFGGTTDENVPHQRTADMFVSWIAIPKLVDACWDALLHYIRNGTIVLPQDLKSFGLPKKYEDRLRWSGLALDGV